MHSLIGTFIKEIPAEFSNSENCTLYSVKILLPPNKSRILYFKDKAIQQKWQEALQNLVGHQNLDEFYEIKEVLGKGQFG